LNGKIFRKRERSAFLICRLVVPLPRPRGAIAIHPDTDAAAILARVLAKPIADEDEEQKNRA
jgi:hypothetical protein